MNLFRHFRRLLDNTKLKYKLLLSYVLFLVLPLITYTYLSYTQASETLRYQTIVSAEQVFGRTVAELNNQTHSMVNALNLITLNQSINRILSNTDNLTWSSQLSGYRTIKDFLENLEKTQEGIRVQIYFSDQLENTADGVRTFTFRQVQDAEWYKRLRESQASEFWFVNEAEGHTYLSVGRIIWNLSNLVQSVGVVKVDYPMSSIHTLLTDALVDRSGQIYMMGDNRVIFAESGSELLGAGPLSDLLADRAADSAERNWDTATYGGRKLLMHHQAIGSTGLKLISLIPMNSVLYNITNLRNQMLVILLAISIVGYLVAMYVARLSTNRIVKLIRNMRKVQEGEFTTYMKPSGQDEIGELVQNFNYMTTRIKQLVDEQFESGKALKNAELRTLQSQINPHFLYNSLDVINIMAIERQAPDISGMVKALTKFYKLGLNRGKDLVTLREETEHIRAYVEIQNIRYDESIRLVLDVPDELMGCAILKLTLQPLVENAILHGILEKKEKQGTIRISAEKRGDAVRVTVADDGVGIREKRLPAPQWADESDDDLHGFGIRNVHERIRLSFGDPYGLRLHSEPGKGTQAVVTIPCNDVNAPA